MIRSAIQDLTYRQRLELLREKKLQQTQEKIRRHGSMDEDDYGTVCPPDDFQWQPIANHPNGSWYGPAGWAANFRSLMEVHPVYVDPMEGIAGRWMVMLSRHRPVRWLPDRDYSHLKPHHELYGINPGIGADTHFAPDYRIGLELGWGGLLKKVRQCRAQHGSDRTEFYQAEEDVILGVQAWIRRTAEACRYMANDEKSLQLRQNLCEMAAMNEWLVENPPRTFREVCQWIAWFNSASRTYNRDGAGGQLDEILRPCYERDTQAGTLDDEEATFYIACLLLNDPHYYQIGGPAPDGQDQVSKVSFLILEAAHLLDSSNNLTVRVHDGQNEEFFLKSVQYLFEDRKGWPRYAGDKGLVDGFMRNGYPAELARQRIATGCHWMAIPGREYPMNDIIKINAAKVFEVAFREMMAESASPSTADLFARFEKHLRKAVEIVAEGLDFHLAHQKGNQPELLLNLLCHGPIEKGRDVSDGGVEFYNMCVDGSALATVADSFAALEQRIEREKVLAWPQIAEALASDYAGPEGTRIKMMMSRSDRYGQGNSLGDAWAVKVSQCLTRVISEKPTPGGRKMIPGWFSWSSTIGMGKVVGATPNGRGAGEPISHGANPNPGFRKDGAPTAMAKAIAAIQCGRGNTCPMQLEIDPSLCRDGGYRNLAALIKTHFDLGGTLMNVNVIDKGKLLAAHKDPQAYPDLVVRVTGFTAYFAALSPAFRQLVVDRILAE
jgi:formate C-acetyltransferase